MKRFVFFLTLGLVLAYAGASLADAGPIDAGAVVNVSADAGVTAADVVKDVGDDPAGFAKDTYDAVKSGQWWLLASLIVIALTWAARKWGAKLVPWLKTDRGGTVLAFAVAFLGGLAHAVAAEGSPSWEMLQTSLKVALGAVGGYTGLRKTLFPKDKKTA
jgi:hypothetical protein